MTSSHQRSMRKPSWALVLGLLVAGCQEKETPAPPAAPPVPVSVTIHASDFAFTAPDTISAGVTTFYLVNDGPGLHHALLVRLDSGKTSCRPAGVAQGAQGDSTLGHVCRRPQRARSRQPVGRHARRRARQLRDYLYSRHARQHPALHERDVPAVDRGAGGGYGGCDAQSRRPGARQRDSAERPRIRGLQADHSRNAHLPGRDRPWPAA